MNSIRPEPSAFIIAIRVVPVPTVSVSASFEPSGDQTGSAYLPGSAVSNRRPEPSGSMSTRRQGPLPGSALST